MILDAFTHIFTRLAQLPKIIAQMRKWFHAEHTNQLRLAANGGRKKASARVMHKCFPPLVKLSDKRRNRLQISSLAPLYRVTQISYYPPLKALTT